MRTLDKIYYLFILIIFVFFLNTYVEKYFNKISNRMISINNVDDYYYKNKISLETLKKNKKIWIHVPFSHNTRYWDSFGSRTSDDLNIPYVYLCIKSVIELCGDDFDIIIYDDSNISDILHDDTDVVDYEKLSGIILEKYREIMKAKILKKYGGISLPCTLYMKKRPQFLNQINDLTACRIPNEGVSKSYVDFIVSPKILACQKECHKMDEYINSLKILDYSEERFKFYDNEYLKENAYIIDEGQIGGKDVSGNVVTLDRLLSNEDIKLMSSHFGLYVSIEQLLVRSKFQWFLRLSPQQIYDSRNRLFIAKYVSSIE
jgi:hypothetical protein